MGHKISIASTEELARAAKEFIAIINGKRSFAFNGQMGAGKTTFIKAICEQLGVEDTISSPTFSIVNEYLTTKGDKVFHFDFYRIKSEQEAYDMGYEDYFYSKAYCFVEWPEKIASLLPPNTINVSITLDGEKRIVTITE
jgi:tRNA threonylcarbamoyladenosine biosynthesis protein TsaE